MTPPAGTAPAATDGFAATLGQLLAGTPGIAGGAGQAGPVQIGGQQAAGQIPGLTIGQIANGTAPGGEKAAGQTVNGLAANGLAEGGAGALLPPRLVAQLPGTSRTAYLPADAVEGGVPGTAGAPDALGTTLTTALAGPDAATKLPRPIAANLPAAVAATPDTGQGAPLPIIFDDTQSDPIEFPDQLPALPGSAWAAAALAGPAAGELPGEPAGELAAADEGEALPAADGQPVMLAALPPEPALPPVRRGVPDLDGHAAEAAKAAAPAAVSALDMPAAGAAEASAPAGAVTEIAMTADTRQPGAGNAAPAAQMPATPPAAQPDAPAIAAAAPPPVAAAPQAVAAPGSARSEAPGARLALDSDFAARMGVQIARRLAQGSDELTVRMDPAELGRIQVRLAFDETGALRAVVAADSASVIEAMRRDLGDITRALADAGVRADGQSFRFDRGSQDGGQGQSAWARWQNARGTAALPGDEPGAQELSYRPVRRNGRLDLIA
ncbi:hypothetical protein GVO57_01545 [Sphingomonas changnyeongensis]|uniref:Flagellar hook-length control protein-like C-terminal domain-containing protein n=1 Tax=Sphingomonas changnyeongensis TaxID=2698679 RepID=A0A7Z2NTU4_9SPHN|nr:flagellar hook-length control protein FliK [Sphingomonas changnyeongensis]QHL89748.1 hypothetical protein GVO57_01545 [Sphingomonas changnyeongensis]